MKESSTEIFTPIRIAIGLGVLVAVGVTIYFLNRKNESANPVVGKDVTKTGSSISSVAPTIMTQQEADALLAKIRSAVGNSALHEMGYKQLAGAGYQDKDGKAVFSQALLDTTRKNVLAGMV